MGFVLNPNTEIDVPKAASLNPSSLTIMCWLKLDMLPTGARGQSGIIKRSLGTVAGTTSDATFQTVINGPGDVGSQDDPGRPDLS